MRRVLIPIDGSEHALQALHYLTEFVRDHGPVEVHLLNVEPAPLAWQTRGMEPEALESQLRFRGRELTKAAREMLDQAGIAHTSHLKLGDAAETIAETAQSLGCDAIVMGTRGLGAISGWVLGSVARKVLHLTDLPVTLVK